MRSIGPVLVLMLAGCGRYADFGLPPPGSGSEVRWSVDASPRPVLERGAPGEWDSVDALNPSVVERGGLLWNFYSGYDGRTWHTGLATSTDGRAWTRRGRVLSPTGWEGSYIAANGTALVDSDRLRYWYQAGSPPRIALADSIDGATWNRHGDPVLALGPRGSWDERAVADPYVLRHGDWLYMAYLGQDRAGRQRLGLARSRDGIDWEKSRRNPILELGEEGMFDENGLGEPALWLAHGRWWMLYTGRDRKEHRRVGLANSRDGVAWRRASEAPVLPHFDWSSKVVCDTTVLVSADGRTVRIWYGGGDQAHPAENIHGAIGFAILHMEPQ
jgi:predicted GH43/DUF377 family glycosyl hydrolase